MTGYAITQIEVTNSEDYKEYLAKVTGHSYKVWWRIFGKRRRTYQCFEGEWKILEQLVIKFPS